MTDQQPQEETNIPVTEQPKKKGGWRTLFIPRKDFYFTPLIVDINIVLFIAMVVLNGDFETLISPKSYVLVQWGANYKPLTLHGEWWRLFTSMFEHIGIIHLAMNMFAFLFVGILLEPILGKALYIVAYIVTGVMSGIVSLWWHDTLLGAGASGAIFGMYGVFLALLTTNFIEKSQRKALLGSIVIFVVYNLARGMKSGIDNAAHVGGLLSGLVIGYIYFLASVKKQATHKWIGITVILVAGAITAFVTLPKIKDPVTAYEKTMRKVGAYENVALKYYSLPDSISNEQRASYLRDSTLPAWALAATEISKLESIQLPEELIKRRDITIEYISYRQNIAQREREKLIENTTRYDNEIDDLNRKIDSVISQMKALRK